MNKYAFVGGVASGVVALDQTTKWYVQHAFRLYQSMPILDSFFSITYLRNPGGAFGLLAGYSSAIRIPFFVAVSGIAVGVLLYFLRQVSSSQPLLLFALSGILGGAIGNFIDRASFGEVVDFLDFHWHGYQWPPFNVADSFITIGTVILLAYSLFTSDRNPGSQAA